MAGLKLNSLVKSHVPVSPSCIGGSSPWAKGRDSRFSPQRSPRTSLHEVGRTTSSSRLYIAGAASRLHHLALYSFAANQSDRGMSDNSHYVVSQSDGRSERRERSHDALKTEGSFGRSLHADRGSVVWRKLPKLSSSCGKYYAEAVSRCS